MAASVRKPYQTRQKELILSCLRAEAGAYLTARQVAERLERDGRAIGMATVYRNLDRLVDEGALAKSTVEGTDGACYRFVAQGEPEHSSLYLKCETCGELRPVGCDELHGFYEHFAHKHHIRIDPVKTVLFGTCPSCLDKESGGCDAARKP